MIFSRIYDTELIKHIMTHERIYPYVIDDGSPAMEKYEPNMHENIWYILLGDSEGIIGLCIIFALNAICGDLHVAALPKARGKRILEAGKMFFNYWIWDNSPFRRLTASIPEYNKHAIILARKVGMIEFGINEKSFLKDGKLYNQILFGISKDGG